MKRIYEVPIGEHLGMLTKLIVRFSVRPKDAARRTFCMTYYFSNVGCAQCESL